jgi:hypothetical protein
MSQAAPTSPPWPVRYEHAVRQERKLCRKIEAALAAGRRRGVKHRRVRR